MDHSILTVKGEKEKYNNKERKRREEITLDIRCLSSGSVGWKK